MLQRREFWASLAFASALVCLSGAGCTPDERELALGLKVHERGEAGSNESSAGAEALAGSAGSAGAGSAASGQAGEAGAAGAPPLASGGTSPSLGGTAGVSNDAGANDAGSAGAPFVGPCGDMDNNAVDDCSETIVQNSRFDSNVDHWSSAVWNARNARSSTSSGSLLVVNDSPVSPEAGFKMVAAEQCLQVTGDFDYEVAARVLIPAGQGGGFGGLNLWIFASDGCQGTFITALTPATTQVVDAWTVVQGSFKMPTAARSMTVRLAATRPFPQAKLQVLFDDILVKQKLR